MAPVTRSDTPRPGLVLSGALFNEPMRIVTVAASGAGRWTLGLVGAQSERFRSVTLGEADLSSLTLIGADHSFDGDPHLLRLALQAYALGIAWEFDPYFGLSISRVDPLPLTSSLQSMTTCSSSRVSAFCSQTMPARERPSWLAC